MKKNRRSRLAVRFSFLAVLILILAACGAAETDDPTATPEPATAGAGQAGDGTAIVIGNVDASNPAQKIEEFQPLADYLAASLASYGISEGRVVIAQDTAEMARMLTDGEVDIYFDAAIPALDVCQEAGCTFALRQWKGGTPDQAGVFVTTKSGGVTSLEDLKGKVIMLEQPHSTVGHILPLVTLAEAGIATRSVSSPEADVGPDEVGFYVSSGGQTSMNLLLNGEIAALAIGDRAYKQFSPDVQEQVMILAETVSAPSQLVAIRPDLDPDLRAEIISLMVGLDQTDEGRPILKGMRETEKFEEMSQDAIDQLLELYEVVKQTIQS
ncbi:MAG: phosphate/phosphite/phosphonate ABC transporter substrate-binding protein [Thermomicrobiales bacterium]